VEPREGVDKRVKKSERGNTEGESTESACIERRKVKEIT
jgi:hypothetical protein